MLYKGRDIDRDPVHNKNNINIIQIIMKYILF